MQDVLAEPLLLRVIEDSVIPSQFIERLVAYCRRTLLDKVMGAPAGEPPLPLRAIAAIAHHSFNTEYVHGESIEEREHVDAVRAAIVSARSTMEPVPLHWYAVFAAYRPLLSLDAPGEIAADLAQTPLSSLAQRQILEPLEEKQLRTAIPALTGTAGAVSSLVQEQYEDNPYPRWFHVDRYFTSDSVAGVLRRLFPWEDLSGVKEMPARILVAGCGTGRHSIETAQRFKDSTVLAVDLSLTSLAYAKRKTREISAGNISYAQGDILALGSIDERFDVVECSGVLHHLQNPLEGWRIYARS